MNFALAARAFHPQSLNGNMVLVVKVMVMTSNTRKTVEANRGSKTLTMGTSGKMGQRLMRECEVFLILMRPLIVILNPSHMWLKIFPPSNLSFPCS